MFNMEKIIEKIEKTVVEEKVTYKSIDGRIWKTEEDCRKWEKSYEGTIMAMIGKIPKPE